MGKSDSEPLLTIVDEMVTAQVRKCVRPPAIVSYAFTAPCNASAVVLSAWKSATI